MRATRIERRGRFRWWIVFPSGPNDGMGTEMGPFLTKTGATLALILERR